MSSLMAFGTAISPSNHMYWRLGVFTTYTDDEKFETWFSKMVKSWWYIMISKPFPPSWKVSCCGSTCGIDRSDWEFCLVGGSGGYSSSFSDVGNVLWAAFAAVDFAFDVGRSLPFRPVFLGLPISSRGLNMHTLPVSWQFWQAPGAFAAHLILRSWHASHAFLCICSIVYQEPIRDAQCHLECFVSYPKFRSLKEN